MRPFRVVCIDPPWKFRDKIQGDKRGAEKFYDCMSFEDLAKMCLPPIADDALMFMWRVGAMQSDALALMHLYGFDMKSELVWVKTRNGIVIEDWDEVDEADLSFGMGHYTRYCHEVCLIGAKGRAASNVVKNKSVRSVFFSERLEHSQKPDKFFDLVEKMTGGEGPYVDIFARKPRPGWVTLGSSLGFTLKEETNEEMVERLLAFQSGSMGDIVKCESSVSLQESAGSNEGSATASLEAESTAASSPKSNSTSIAGESSNATIRTSTEA